tara:strand:+ start:3052 stop:3411 length:360 start_codon:yes stop_codon:yes gene_type:complete
MTAHKYNGWTNYATWNIKLWMDNDCFAYELWYDEALKALDKIPAGKDRLHEATLLLMEVMQTHFENELPDHECCTGWIADFLQHTLGEVNWYEIAECVIDDAWETDAKRESHNERGGAA